MQSFFAYIGIKTNIRQTNAAFKNMKTFRQAWIKRCTNKKKRNDMIWHQGFYSRTKDVETRARFFLPRNYVSF